MIEEFSKINSDIECFCTHKRWDDHVVLVRQTININ